MSNDINTTIERFFQLRAAIFEHVGYVEDWRVFPLDDSRDQYWSIHGSETNGEVRFSPKREAIEYWNGGHYDQWGHYGHCVYSNEIYTQRHLPKWVYRGAEIVLIVVDTNTDGNKFLQLFDVAKEVK